MANDHSDALVFYGVTGDLAFKKIFPALQAMVKRGQLNVPVVGVARSPWNVEQLRQRVRESLEKHGGVDPAAFDKLAGLLRYVSVDYTDSGACRNFLGATCAVEPGARVAARDDTSAPNRHSRSRSASGQPRAARRRSGVPARAGPKSPVAARER